MDSGEVIQLLFVVVLLMLSAFFSSAETALTTSNKIRLKGLADEGDKRAKRVLEITGDSGKMLSAILIGNNICRHPLLPLHLQSNYLEMQEPELQQELLLS